MAAAPELKVTNRRCGAVYPLTIMRLKLLAVATTTVVRKVSVVCGNKILLLQQQGQLLPKHTTAPWGQKQRALWITVPPCARVST
eukprot:1541707-Pleurochrysis_carterae.AAC.1